MDVTLFATADSITSAKLRAVCPVPYEEDRGMDAKVWECLHISEVMEQADEFDLIHNNYDFIPLTYSRMINTPMVTTIHGFSSPRIVPVYKKYNDSSFYVSISNADRSPELDYISTVYHGIDLDNFRFNASPGEYLLYFGRIHHDKGTYEAIRVARESGRKLIIAGVIQDKLYYEKYVEPYLDDETIIYAGSAGPKERDNLLGGAYALLHPINFEEPFGLSVVEAMACGTPVIAFAKGAMPEIIEDGVNGFLVSHMGQMIDRIKDVGSISREQCRRTVENRFTRERMVKDYLNVYQNILKGKFQQRKRYDKASGGE